MVENIIYTGMGEDHPGLYREAFFIQNKDVHWVRPDLALKEEEEQMFYVRIRYRQPLQRAQLICKPNGLFVRFDVKQKAITPGQFAAWYANNELVGSGIIYR